MYLSVLSALGKKAKVRGLPFYGVFELTPRCNLRCKFCYVCERTESIKPTQEKSSSEWLDMIRQSAAEGMLKCTFTGGDPFMREDFEEIYRKSYDMGLRLSVFTNGILIGKKQRAWLAKRIPDVLSISLYGASAKSYEEVCGNGDDYKRIIASLNGLHTDNIPFVLKTLAIRPLMNEYESIGSLISGYNCQGSLGEYLSPARDDHEILKRDWRITGSEMNLAKAAFYKPLIKETSEYEKPPAVKKDAGRIDFNCIAGSSEFMIAYDGRMIGCPMLTCFETFPFKDGFRYAWNELKRMVREAAECEECSTCAYSDACYRCPAMRFTETGSIAKCSAYIKELAQALQMAGSKYAV